MNSLTFTPWRQRAALWLACLAAALLLGAGARAQGDCLVLGGGNAAPETAGQMNGIGCATAVTGDAELFATWTFTESDMNRRPLTLTLRSAPGQHVRLDLLLDSGSAAVATLVSEGGADAQARWHLIPGEYTLRFTVAGEGGRFVLRTDNSGNAVSVNLSPAGSSDRASRESGSFDRLGRLTGAADYIRLTVSEESAGRNWLIAAGGTPGFPLTLKLYDENGNELMHHDIAAGERLELWDTPLPTGVNTFVLSPIADDPRAGYHLRVSLLGEIAEDGVKTGRPGRQADANRITLASGISGTLEEDNTDYYHLNVTEEEAGFYELRVNNDLSLTLCFHDRERQLACYGAASDIHLPLLRLDAGEYWLSLNGNRQNEPAYDVRFVPVPAPTGDNIAYAISANRETAFLLPESLAARVSHGLRMTTWFAVDLPESGLYRVQVQGTGQIANLNVADGGGADVRREFGVNRLDNVPLRAGLNYVVLDGHAGDYAVRVMHLGPLPTDEPQAAQEAVTLPPMQGLGDPDDLGAELAEQTIAARPAGTVVPATNVSAGTAAHLVPGRDYVGTIDGPGAHYRFSLMNEAHVRLTLTPPDDGQMRLRLTPADSGDRTTAEPGQELVLDHWLPAGDYRIEIRMNNDSHGWYMLRLDELDPLDLPWGLSPLNSGSARTIPADNVLSVQGRQNEHMAFRLPLLPADTRLDVVVLAGPLQSFWINRAPDINSGSRVTPTEEDRDSGTASFELEGGVDYLVVLRSGFIDEWHVSFEFAQGMPARELADPHEVLELSVELDAYTVAAWSRLGQALDGTFTATNTSDGDVAFDLLVHATDPRATVTGLPDRVELAAGQSAELPLRLILPDDLRSDRPLTVTLGLSNEDGVTATTAADIMPTCEAPQLGAHAWWPEPFASLTYWNHALDAFGAVITGTPSSGNDPRLIDGRTSPAQPPAVNVGKVYRLDLGREATLLATVLHPIAGGSALERLRDFEIAVSDDGENWQPILTATMSGAGVEQFFEFPEPVTTRHVQLTPLSNQGRTGGAMAVGEWKLLGTEAPLEAMNLADHALGGHLVLSNRMNSGATGMLGDTRGEENTARPNLSSVRNHEVDWVLGFHENRAAMISGLEWQDYPLRSGHIYVPGVRVYVSTASPLGPWEHVADWNLQQTRPGNGSAAEDESPQLQILAFDEPVWARFVRFETMLGEDLLVNHINLNLPSTLRVIEHAGDGYRSILSEWGMDRQHASYEHAHPELLELATVDFGANGERGSAAVLRHASSGFVQTGGFEAWYEFEVSADANHVTLEVESGASVALDYEVFDADGRLVAAGLSGGSYAATLPAGTYHLRIAEPPRSIAFVWDNSGSVSHFTPMIYAALDRFAAGISPEMEEVMLAVFSISGANFLLPDWSGDADEVSRALNEYARNDGSSDSDTALIRVNGSLAGRQGSRAILHITDAEFGMSATPVMWETFATARPQVFSMHVSTASTAVSQDFMQDIASAYGGLYTAAPTLGDLELGLLRADCLIRRPKPYHVTVGFEARTAEPGTLSVASALAQDGEAVAAAPTGIAGAIQVILDASGSMWQTLDGRFRYQIANDVLVDLVTDVLPEGVPFALRVFGNREANVCRSDLEVALAPLAPAVVAAVIAGVEPQPFAGTPLAESILLARQDLADAGEPRTVILITDGEESCDGDVESAIAELRSAGVDVVLNVIGFDFDAADIDAARERFRAWAELGGGQYFDATDAAELAEALERSVAPPFEVLDGAGAVVARGTVDGPVLELPGGAYTIRVLTEPPVLLEDVHIDGGSTQVTVAY